MATGRQPRSERGVSTFEPWPGSYRPIVGARTAASRRHYEKNRDRYLERANAAKVRAREHVQAIKAATPCADCGEDHPWWRMDFDHRPGEAKRHDIAWMVSNGQSVARIDEEIAKCDVVCANCHRDRTHARATLAAVHRKEKPNA